MMMMMANPVLSLRYTGGDDDDGEMITNTITAQISIIELKATTKAAQDLADPRLSHGGHPLRRPELQSRAAAAAMATVVATLHSHHNMALRGSYRQSSRMIGQNQ